MPTDIRTRKVNEHLTRDPGSFNNLRAMENFASGFSSAKD